MTTYRISPLDRLFFRTNTPFDMERSSDVKTVFPPYPSTITGMARTMMATANGWDGTKWTDRERELVGDLIDLKGMKFRGPFLEYRGDLLLPIPRNLVRFENGDFDLLRPSERIFECNLGHDGVRLPQPSKDDTVKQVTGFVKSSNLEKILRGEHIKDNEIIAVGDLWVLETQVGNSLDHLTKTTGKENSLFSREFVRPKEGVSLLLMIENETIGIDGQIGHLGGEARMVTVEKHADITFPECREGNRFTITFVTPAHLGYSNSEVMKELEATFGAPPVSACLPNPVMIGGWDYAKREPKALRPHLIPGTVFFFETELNIETNPKGIYHVGEGTDFGYGQYLIGKW